MRFGRKLVEKKKNRSYRKGAVLVLALAVAGAATAFAASQVSILETGSSLLYPLFNLWVPVYTKAHPNVRITTQSTGSGTGISDAVAGIAQIGASDAYLSNALKRMHPSMLSIPLAISSQMINYNLPGLNKDHVKLTGPVLADIYTGKVTMWNAAQIRKLNPGLHLPDHKIIPVHRTDGSGDTFLFTQFLSFSTPSWNHSIHFGTTVSWPAVSGELGAEGNQGMLSAVKGSNYSIAYIGISYENSINKDGLGIAALGNKAGNFVIPTPHTVSAAAAQMVPKTPKDERVSLIYAPGAKSYPIINYEYAIVSDHQPTSRMASTLRNFFDWAISKNGGNAPHFLKQVHFAPLPSSVVKLSKAQINEIH